MRLARSAHSCAPFQPRAAIRSTRVWPTVGASCGDGSGVLKGGLDVVAQTHGDDARAQLGDAEVGGLQELPLQAVADLAQVVFDVRAILRELGIQQAAHVLNHDGSRAHDAHELDHGGKEVAFVVGAQLLARVGEGRAGHASGDQVNPGVLVRVLLDPGDASPSMTFQLGRFSRSVLQAW